MSSNFPPNLPKVPPPPNIPIDLIQLSLANVRGQFDEVRRASDMVANLIQLPLVNVHRQFDEVRRASDMVANLIQLPLANVHRQFDEVRRASDMVANLIQLPLVNVHRQFDEVRRASDIVANLIQSPLANVHRQFDEARRISSQITTSPALFSPSPSVLAFLRPPPSISIPPDITVGLPTPHKGPPVPFDQPQLSDPKYYRLELHSEVIKYCETELIQRNYFHAVEEAVKGLAQRIRDKSGIQLDGAELIDRVFSTKKPILAFNTLQTQSEKSEHNGSVMLLKGCFGTIRNPYAHEPKILCPTEIYAREYLVTISMLHRKLDECILMDPDGST